MRVAMIDAGYVGLVSGACFADFGSLVCCVDTDETKIAALEGGRMPIYEPGLEALVETNVRARRLTFTGDPGPHRHRHARRTRCAGHARTLPAASLEPLAAPADESPHRRVDQICRERV